MAKNSMVTGIQHAWLLLVGIVVVFVVFTLPDAAAALGIGVTPSAINIRPSIYDYALTIYNPSDTQALFSLKIPSGLHITNADRLTRFRLEPRAYLELSLHFSRLPTGTHEISIIAEDPTAHALSVASGVRVAIQGLPELPLLAFVHKQTTALGVIASGIFLLGLSVGLNARNPNH
ncbi:MAG: hypothetical protein UY09_C0007G0019 [Parcubacteria group bacterium GW2011_GWA2_47_8]|nr:MAG: hypothetical protein UY09_C0007G0019 [Parcubacteria group bacterium GW2011_GWA2_47_8]